MTRRIAGSLLVAALAVGAFAQDGSSAKSDDATTTATDAETKASADPIAFGDDLDAAQAAARGSKRPLLVVAVPDWYDSPMWARVEEKALVGNSAAPLEGFVRVLVHETRDREIHVRHRVPFEGYPLAVVLGADGTYLGHLSGLPGDGDVASWSTRIGEIPERAEKIAELRTRLDAEPENPTVLFELGKLLAAAGEADRADALFERMERADPLAVPERLGEARYLSLRHRIVDLMQERKFADVEGLCLKWQRRFSEHGRLADVLLLQANARYLANRHDDAKALWQRLVDEHADTDAGKAAKKALAGL